MMGNAIEKPQNPRTAGKKFWLIKKLIFDVDQLLNKSQIFVDSCTYHSDRTNKDFAYKGLGPCLYHNFMDSMSTDKVAGITYFWLSDSSQDTAPIEIHWRPPVGGLKKVAHQALEMKLEGPLYWLRTKVNFLGDAEELHYQQFLLGDIDIIFPPSFAAESFISGQSVVSHILKSFLSDARTVSLKAAPVHRQEGLVFHSGKLTAELSTETENSESKVISFITNLNIASIYREATYDLTNTANGLLYAP